MKPRMAALAILLAGSLAGLLPCAAAAAGPAVQAEGLPLPADTTLVPETARGSLHIHLEASLDGRSRENVTFALVRVADLQDGYYVLQDAYAGLDLDLNELDTAAALEEAAWTLMEQGGTPLAELVTDAQGEAWSGPLENGVYLLYVTDHAGYEAISPLLAALPAWDEKEGAFLYDLDIYPKHEALPFVEVNKTDSLSQKNITSKAFEFTAYQDAACTQVLTTVAGKEETGTALFELDLGTIWIKETKAPAGYQLSEEVVKVEVNHDGLFINDVQAQVPEDRVYAILYQNALLPSSGMQGPGTGASSGWARYALLGAVSLGGVSLLLFVRRHQHRQAG